MQPLADMVTIPPCPPPQILVSCNGGNPHETETLIFMWILGCPVETRCDWSGWWRRAGRASASSSGCHRGCWDLASAQSQGAGPWSWSSGKCLTFSASQSRRRHWATGWASASGKPRWRWRSGWSRPGSGPVCHTFWSVPRLRKKEGTRRWEHEWETWLLTVFHSQHWELKRSMNQKEKFFSIYYNADFPKSSSPEDEKKAKEWSKCTSDRLSLTGELRDLRRFKCSAGTISTRSASNKNLPDTGSYCSGSGPTVL